MPGTIELGRLLTITDRIDRDEETEEDPLRYSPGSLFEGARLKASVIDQHSRCRSSHFARKQTTTAGGPGKERRSPSLARPACVPPATTW